MFVRRATQRLLEFRLVIRQSLQISRSFSTAHTHHIDPPDNSSNVPWEFTETNQEKEANQLRKHANFTVSTLPEEYTSPEEYAKAIRVAGEAENIDRAVELFNKAVDNQCKTSVTYNALMGAYMDNGLTEECQSLFQKFKKDQSCSPNIATYNILITVFGRLLYVDHMEATLQEIYNLRLIPNVYTFNNLIKGYVIAWMWDRMENTYSMMKEKGIEPNIGTYKLMVRGYAHAGNLKKMEKLYELLKQHSSEDDILSINIMIPAYCKSSCAKKVQKIDFLFRLIPEGGHKSWLISSLIRFYAQVKQLDKMEEIISLAFKNNVVVTSGGIMRVIATAYYRHNAVDKLSSFVKCAESAGWSCDRLIYDSKMAMYASSGRLEEMENVLEEMEKYDLNSRTKKSLTILCSAYSTWGPRCKLEQVVALMLKLGYDIHWEKHFPKRDM